MWGVGHLSFHSLTTLKFRGLWDTNGTISWNLVIPAPYSLFQITLVLNNNIEPKLFQPLWQDQRHSLNHLALAPPLPTVTTSAPSPILPPLATSCRSLALGSSITFSLLIYGEWKYRIWFPLLALTPWLQNQIFCSLQSGAYTSRRQRQIKINDKDKYKLNILGKVAK